LPAILVWHTRIAAVLLTTNHRQQTAGFQQLLLLLGATALQGLMEDLLQHDAKAGFLIMQLGLEQLSKIAQLWMMWLAIVLLPNITVLWMRRWPQVCVPWHMEATLANGCV